MYNIPAKKNYSKKHDVGLAKRYVMFIKERCNINDARGSIFVQITQTRVFERVDLKLAANYNIYIDIRYYQ